jgi:class 3 adenylate cyclase
MEIGNTAKGPSKQISALLFTDIVGSVALQRKLGTSSYTRYVSRHDEIIKECLSEVSDAKILNETGDGFLIRFIDPSDAVNTALRLQYRLSLEKCEGESINVRMGLNMGLITEMDEANRGATRAVGMPINLVARVMDLGGAGQILMTRVVYDDAKQFVRNHPDSGLSDTILPPPEWLSHGSYEVDGNDENIEVFEIGLRGIAPLTAPVGSKKARPANQETNKESDSNSPTEEPEPLDIENLDVLISYADVDNEPLRPGEDGWISQLQRNLKVRMEQITGEEVKISRLSGKNFESIGPGGEIIKGISEAKAVVPVISPPFTNSPGCQKEMELFYNPKANSYQPESLTPAESKLVNAIKMPVPSGELPYSISSVITQCPALEFFEREETTGRVREFHEDFGEDSRQRYYERVYDLAYELCETLKNRKDFSSTDSTSFTDGRQKVFLAPTTSELTKEYDTVKRELKEHGYHVVPDRPLPLSVDELNEALEEMIIDCVTSIHLMGHHYGLIPERSSSSLGEILLRFTANKASSGLKRFIWSPRDFADGEAKQVELLEKIQEDPSLHSAAELIEGSIVTLKRDIFRVIQEQDQRKKAEADANKEIKPVNDSKLIYLICEQRDEEAVEALEDYLFKEGLEVCLPAFEGDEADVKALHQENLINCSGALVYYGAAPRAWVDIKLRDLIKAVGYGRENPIEKQAVFIASPHDHRKERYKSHTAKIIRQNDESFSPSDDLKDFIEAIKET